MVTNPKPISPLESQKEIGSLRLYSGKNHFYWSPFKGLHNSPKDQTSFRGNRNFCVSGRAGSGKSIFCKQTIANVLAGGGKVVVFDNEQDYYPLCLQLGGDYLTAENTSDLSVDLFSMVPDGETSAEKYERDEVLTSLENLILMMDLPTESVAGENKDYVRKALGNVWRKKGQSGQLIDVINALEVQDYLIREGAPKRGEELAKSLSRYLVQHQSFFKKNKENCIKSDFTVVDVDKFKPFMRQALITWILMRVSHHQRTTNNKKPFLVLFEDSVCFEVSQEFSNVIKAFSIGARKKRISLGKVSYSVRSSYTENKCPLSLLERVFWDFSDCKILFREDSPKDFDLFAEFYKSKLPKGYLKTFHSLFDQSHSFEFAMVSEGHPFRVYKTVLEGDGNACIAA